MVDSGECRGGRAERDGFRSFASGRFFCLVRWMNLSPALALALLAPVVAFSPVRAAEGQKVRAFPEAQGYGAFTPGGRGGKIVRVTTLEAKGEGSLAAALGTKGPRIVVFEVGGVIDLKGKSLSLREPFVTIAGQTAPSPGITLVRGGLNVATHDVVVQHIAIRPGEAGRKKKSGWEVDGMTTDAASNVIVDHCSFTWATDENLSASGPRFEGAEVESWRAATSHDVTFSNCIIAEGLSESTHAKGEHSKGSLLHDNTTAISVIGNLYASNMERNPLAKGGVQAVIVNNWISNPGRRAVHYILSGGEWKGHEPVTGRLALVGNVLEHGADTPEKLALLSTQNSSPLELFVADNLVSGRDGKPAALTDPATMTLAAARPLWPEGLEPLPAEKVREHVAKNAGARPWDRDPIDQRIVRAALERTGRIIDSEQEVGGYPERPATRAEFRAEEWDLATMRKNGDR